MANVVFFKRKHLPTPEEIQKKLKIRQILFLIFYLIIVFLIALAILPAANNL